VLLTASDYVSNHFSFGSFFKALWKPDSIHTRKTQQTWCGFLGEEWTSSRGVHPPIPERAGQSKCCVWAAL